MVLVHVPTTTCSTKMDNVTSVKLLGVIVVHRLQTQCVWSVYTDTGQILWMDSVTVGGHRVRNPMPWEFALTVMFKVVHHVM